MNRVRKWGKRLLKLFIFLVLIICILEYWLRLSPPPIADTSAWNLKRDSLAPKHYYIKNNWLLQNKHGLWEAYVSGQPFERGAILGNLAQELIRQQEIYFVAQIKELVPSTSFLYVLRYLIGFFNRNINHYIPLEYQKEIYGETHFGSDEFSMIGSNYERILNYHAAHDIGHALSDYAMVGCTSFAQWQNTKEDSSLIVGRNFDFYVGDDFAKDKMILFVAPSEGYKFASITWGGFMGVVSGMNEKGLTVSLNAAKSGLPSSAKTPISIVARDILQYAQNIEEAFAIAQKHETFVSESLMIASAADNKTVIIEKSIDKTVLFETNTNSIICSNHYQSDSFATDADNRENIQRSASDYRQKRTLELMQSFSSLNYLNVAQILRDKQGLKGENIGWGNEKALNQLLGHHSVIFMPKKRLMWVSTSPYQLGEYVAYDLNQIFQNRDKIPSQSVAIDSLLIAEDEFAKSKEFDNYLKFRVLKKEIEKRPESTPILAAAKIIKLNPDYYHAYQLAAQLSFAHQQYAKAKGYYQTALSKEIATLGERKTIEEALYNCENLLKNN